MITSELTTAQIKNVIDQTLKYRPAYYISGGESFIRPDCLEIIKYIDSKGLVVGLTDNGTILDDNTLRELAKLKKLMIVFSVDGPKEVHEKIRGPGSFDKTMECIRKLVEYRGDSRYPVVRTNTTFSPWIQGHTKELVNTLQDAGSDAVFFQHLWFTNKERAEAHEAFLKQTFNIEDKGAESHIISMPTQIYAEQLADEISELEHTKFKSPVYIRPQMTKEQIVKYYTDLSWSYRKRCTTPWNDLIIKANGDAIFCPDQWIAEYRLGNVKTDTIDSIWYGEKAMNFRKELNKNRLFPTCARCCAIN